MSSYVIGDIQGCHSELCRLLDMIGFSPKHDRLWCVGDLVNRGPASANVLRELMALGSSAQSVLGNHDFHLLVAAAGFQKLGRRDHLDDILSAKDREAMLDWLRHRPLAIRFDHYLLVHAGVIPSWSADDVVRYAHEVETVLRSNDRDTVLLFLQHLYGNTPERWDARLRGQDRLRAIVNICARLRFCTEDGTMNFSEKGSRDHPPPDMRPWFAFESRHTRNVTVLCGHWSMLGLSLMPGVLALDSGCLWGGTLTAVRLEDRQVFQVPSEQRLFCS
ncbi:MAG: symmetrical bis(5'-nucleosyl)-tetraphosphatase [Proteobacteria bacterium]|nr:symmetrical bis(5'-nucleosyl)-tetraphosphatase [Pseudomonadota bacterium]MCL2308035.1 symmetrical bis(5'-nucleosyl)-tetraphosphatase [Pseudomonadota bacterium]